MDIGWYLTGHLQTHWGLYGMCRHLVDDDVAERIGLPSPQVRAQWLRWFLAGYGLAAAERGRVVPLIVEFAAMDNAWFARSKTSPQNNMT